MISLNSCSKSELKDLVASLGEKNFRAEQIYKWLYNSKVLSISDMTNLPARFREQLAEIAGITTITESERSVSKIDGSMKLLFTLADGERIESVILRDRDRVTACISTQVGCKMGCKFCATAGIGFIRNLKTAEILEQIHHLEQIVVAEGISEEPRLTSIVFMGMGEPLDNFDSVVKALAVLTDEEAYSYSHRRITVSTSGIIPQIKKLFDIETPVRLAVSVNAPNQDIRRAIMPLSAKYDLPTLIKTLKDLPVKKRERITLEYVLLGGVNDSIDDAREFLKLIKNVSVKVNLIKYNGNEGFEAPSEKNILAFQKVLTDNNISAFIRKSLGRDIFGACGQLAAKYL